MKVTDAITSADGAARSLEQAAKVVRFGLGKGKVKIAADFDAPLPEEMLALFEGRVADTAVAAYGGPIHVVK
ncbi:MAG: hypothetical protein R3B70_28985 [Polyangiaceae bacterium]